MVNFPQRWIGHHLLLGSFLHDAVICRQAQTCKDPMETQYYSSVCVTPVCWYCGSPEEMLTNDDFIQNLRSE